MRISDWSSDVCSSDLFSPAELIARINAVLRRSKPELSSEMLTFADLAMDLAAHRVKRNGQDIHLGPTEFRLLRHLMQHPGRVFTREQLLDSVWRSEERRVGTEGVSTCRSRWAPCH